MKYGPFNSNLCVDYSSIYIQFYCKLPKTRSYHLIYSPFSPRQTAFQAITKKKLIIIQQVPTQCTRLSQKNTTYIETILLEITLPI